MPFLPSDLSGLSCWLKSDAGTYSDTGLTTPASSDGDLVAGWADRSGNAADFLLQNAGTATAPTLKTNIQNGLPVLRFNGTSNVLLNTTLGILFRDVQPFTLIVAASQSAASSGVLASWNTSSGNLDYGYLRLRDSGSTPSGGQTVFRINADTGPINNFDVGSDFVNFAVVYDGTNITISQMNDSGAVAADGPNVSTINQVVLGCIVRPSNPNGVLFCACDIGEIILYNSALSAADLTLVYTYLQGRWAVAPTTAPTVVASSFWDGVGLTWGAITNATSYIVQRSPVGAGTWSTLGTTKLLRYFDSGLVQGASWDYRVAASNDSVLGTYCAAVTGTVVSGAATMLNIAPCIRWGKVDALALADGTPISTYTDLSGSSHDFAQTGTNRPVSKDAIQNGKAMALFTAASSQYLKGDVIATTFSGDNVPRSIVMVLKHASVAGSVGVQAAWMLANSGSQSQTNDFLFEPTINSWATANRNDSLSREYLVGAGDADTNAHALIFVFDGTNVSIYVDGTLCNQSAFDVGRLTLDEFTYGAHRRGQSLGSPTLDAFLQGYIGEDAVYTCALTTAQVAQVSSLLVGRWATPASAAFAPSQIPGIIGHFRDDSITGNTSMSDGASVNTWYNRTNGGLVGGTSVFYDLTATGSPTLAKASLNGRDTIALPGGTNYFLSANNLLPPFFSGTGQPFTVFGVFKADAVASNQELWSLGNNGSSAAHSNRLTSAPAYAAKQINNAAATTTLTGGTPDTSAHAFIYTFDGTTGTLSIDGNVVATGTLPGGATTFNRLALGALLGAAASNPFVGNIAEFGIYDRVIDGGEESDLFDYMVSRWGTPPPDTTNPTAPGTPTAPVFTIGNVTGTVSVPSSFDADHYEWQRDIGRGFENVTGSSSTINVTVPGGEICHYRVRAISSDGEPSDWTTPTIITGDDFKIPSQYSV